MENKNTKRLNVDLDRELHIKLKTLASERNITLSAVVVKALLKFVEWSKKYE